MERDDHPFSQPWPINISARLGLALDRDREGFGNCSPPFFSRTQRRGIKAELGTRNGWPFLSSFMAFSYGGVGRKESKLWKGGHVGEDIVIVHFRISKRISQGVEGENISREFVQL